MLAKTMYHSMAAADWLYLVISKVQGFTVSLRNVKNVFGMYSEIDEDDNVVADHD